MVIATSKDGLERILVYQQSILLVDKEDTVTFIVDNNDLKYTFVFSFTKEGEKYSTTFFEEPDRNQLHYRLNNWDNSVWVEISKPILVKVKNETKKIWLKFRSNAQENKDFRKFDLTIWKER